MPLKIMLKILILGSSGTLGKQIYKELKTITKIELFHTGLKKRKIDFTNKAEFKKFISSINPDLIINCIAYTNVDKCENYTSLSKKINFEIVKEIFKLKVKKELRFNFIHFSTDQFYNQIEKKPSNETSKIFLINNYCKHKRMAELECIKNKSLIFRTNFFGKSLSKNNSFSDWIFKAFKNKKQIYLFRDIYFNPLRIKTIAKVILAIVLKKKYNIQGIYNLAAKGALYKDEFAILFSKKVCIYHRNYIKINSDKVLKVKRSKNMYMNVKKFEKKFQFKLPNIQSEIRSEVKNYTISRK